MRPVYAGDLMDAARALRGQHPSARRAIARDIVARADIADRYRKRLHKAHPRFGTGTLASAARGFKMAQVPAFCDAEHLACLADVITALRDARCIVLHNR